MNKQFNISDLNNFLFSQLERISNTDLKGQELEEEINRADAMSKVAGEILKSADIALKWQHRMDEYGCGEIIDNPLIGITDGQLMKENKRLKETVRAQSSRIKKYEDYE